MLRSALLALVISVPTVSVLAQPAPPTREPLEQRLNAAEAAHTLRQAYFDASGDPPLTLEQAFSHLAGAPLSDPSFLLARQRSLDEQRDARARERLDAGGSDRSQAVAHACDAEDAADALEERLLSALTVGLEIVPGLNADSIDLARGPWRAARDSAGRMAEDDPSFPDARREAVAAAEAERRLLLYQSAALRRMTIPRDPGLRRLVEEELAAGDELELDDNARDRLSRAAPLLSDELSLLVDAALAGSATAAYADASAPSNAAAAASPVAPNATTQLREVELERHAASVERLRTLDSRYSELEAEFLQARTLSILDEARARRLLESAHASRDLVRTIRGAVGQQLAIESTHRAERRERRRGLSGTRAGDGIDSVAALDERDANTTRELDALLGLEKRALALRRELEPFGAPLTRQLFFEELVEELKDGSLWLQLDWHNVSYRLSSLPGRATDLNAVGELIGVSFDLLVLGFLWIYLRNRMPRWLSRATTAIRRKDVSGYGFSRQTPHASERELEPIARYAADAVGAFSLHRLLLPRSEFLALLALIWVGWALLKCIRPAIRLILPLAGRALDPLEAQELPTEVRALGEKTASWFLWWWIVSAVAAFIAVPLLQADRLSHLVKVLSLSSFVVLLVLTLARWSLWTRHFIANMADQSAISTELARPVRSRIAQIFRSAVGSIYILLRLVFWALVDRGWLSRSGTSIALSQLNLVDANAVLLFPEARERIRASDVDRIARTEELELVQRAFESWQRERRRGIVAVIGDNGMGKSVFLNQALAVLKETSADMEVTKLELPIQKRSSGIRERLEWLTEPLELTIPKNATRSTLHKVIVEHLESLPPRVFLVDDLHFLLRRTVGGFEALEIARNIIQACADEHFWVLTLHRPAWVYINGVSTAMKLAFRERIELPALDADELGESLVETTRAAGFFPEFRSLVLGQRPHADKETLEHKARRLYWKIVFQASRGNPRVIVDFWLSSLGAPEEAADSDDGKRPVPVYLFAGHGDEEIADLSDEYLFLLTAIVVHDGLNVDDLAEVLNVTLSRVHVSCQHLESLGIVNDVESRYVVAPSWQPTVARVLERRNFAHH